MFSSTSYAEWTKVGVDVDGDSFYVDFDRIREVDGYVYFWRLTDLSKPIEGIGVLSGILYIQGDCKLFREKVLKYFYYKEPMGEGVGKTITAPDEWDYPPPKSSMETILKSVCDWVK